MATSFNKRMSELFAQNISNRRQQRQQTQQQTTQSTGQRQTSTPGAASYMQSSSSDPFAKTAAEQNRGATLGRQTSYEPILREDAKYSIASPYSAGVHGVGGYGEERKERGTLQSIGDYVSTAATDEADKAKTQAGNAAQKWFNDYMAFDMNASARASLDDAITAEGLELNTSQREALYKQIMADNGLTQYANTIAPQSVQDIQRNVEAAKNSYNSLLESAPEIVRNFYNNNTLYGSSYDAWRKENTKEAIEWEQRLRDSYADIQFYNELYDQTKNLESNYLYNKKYADANSTDMLAAIDYTSGAEKKWLTDNAKTRFADEIESARLTDPDYAAKVQAGQASDNWLDKYLTSSPFVQTLKNITNNSNLDAQNYLTDTEKENYYYAVANGGNEAGQRYIVSILPELQQRTVEDKTQSANALSRLGYSLASGYTANLRGIEQAVRAFFGDDTVLQPMLHEYIQMSQQQDLSGGELTMNQIVQAIGGMLPAIATSAVTGGATAALAPAASTLGATTTLSTALPQVAGAATMGLGSGGNAYAEALNAGYSKEQAAQYGFITGTSEALLTYLLSGISSTGGKVTQPVAERVSGAIENAIQDPKVYEALASLGAAAVGMTGEGFEEYLQDTLDPVFRNMIFGEDNDFTLMSDQQLQSFIVGALTAGLMNAPTTIGDAVAPGIQTDTSAPGFIQNQLANLNPQLIQSQMIPDANMYVGENAAQQITSRQAQSGLPGTIAVNEGYLIYDSVQSMTENTKKDLANGDITFEQFIRGTEQARDFADAYPSILETKIRIGDNVDTVYDPDTNTLSLPVNYLQQDTITQSEEMTSGIQMAIQAADPTMNQSPALAKLAGVEEGISADMRNATGELNAQEYSDTWQNKDVQQLLDKYNVKTMPQAELGEGNVGAIRNGELYISDELNTSQAVKAVVAHELSHKVSQDIGVDKMMQNVRKYVDKYGIDIYNPLDGTSEHFNTFEEALQALPDNYATPLEKANELGSRFFDSVLAQKSNIDQFLNDNRTFREKFMGTLSDIVQYIKAAFGNETAQQYIAELQIGNEFKRRLAKDANLSTADADLTIGKQGKAAADQVGIETKKAAKEGEYILDEGQLVPDYSHLSDIYLNDLVQNGTTLGELIGQDSVLASLYEGINDMVVEFNNENKGARYDKKNDSIHVNPEFFNMSRDEQISSLIHEIQHAIQAREGMQQGTSASAIKYLQNAGRINDVAYTQELADQIRAVDDNAFVNRELAKSEKTGNITPGLLYYLATGEQQARQAEVDYGKALSERSTSEPGVQYNTKKGEIEVAENAPKKAPTTVQSEATAKTENKTETKTPEKKTQTKETEKPKAKKRLTVSSLKAEAQAAIDALVPDDTYIGQTQSSIYQSTLDAEVKTMMNADSYLVEHHTEKDVLKALRQKVEEIGVDDATRIYLRDKSSDTSRAAQLLGAVLLETAADKGDLKTATKIAEMLVKKSSAAGQALQATSILKRLTPGGALYYAERALSKVEQKANETAEKRPGLKKWMKENPDSFRLTETEQQQLIKYMQEAEGHHPTDKAYKLAISKANALIQSKVPPSLGNQVFAIARDFMLSSPITTIRNVLANVVLLPEQIGAQVIASVADKALSKTTGQRTTFNPDAKIFGKGFLQGAIDAWTDYRTGENTRGELGVRYALDTNGGEIFKPDFSNTKTGKAFSKAFRAIDNSINFLLDIGDRPFYQAYFDDAVNGLVKSQFGEDAKVTQATPEILTIANNIALNKVYQDRSVVAKAMTGLQKWLNNLTGNEKYGLGNFIGPFLRTPANIMYTTFQFSPAGLVKAITGDAAKLNKAMQAVKNNTDPAKVQGLAQNLGFAQTNFVNNLGKGVTGSLIMMLGGLLVEAGLLQGGGEDDEKKDKFAKATEGWTPYSVKINGKYYGFSWADPFYQQMVMGAKVAEADSAIDAITAPLEVLYEQYGDLALVQGIIDLFSADSLEDLMLSTGSNIAKQFIPNAVKWLNRALDPYQRQINVPGDPAQSALNSIMADLPGLRQMLPTKTDAYGNDLAAEGTLATRLWSPFGVTGDRYDGSMTAQTSAEPLSVESLITAEVKTLNDNSIVPNEMTVSSVSIGGTTYDLDKDAQKKYSQVRGEAYKTLAGELIQSQSYQLLDNQSRIQMLKKVNTIANEMAKADYAETNGIEYEPNSQVKAFNAPDPAAYLLVDQEINDDTWADREGIERDMNGNIPSIDKKAHMLEVIDSLVPMKDRQYYYDAYNINPEALAEKLESNEAKRAQAQSDADAKAAVEQIPKSIVAADDYDINDATKAQIQEAAENGLNISDYMYIKDRRSAYTWQDKYDWYMSQGLDYSQVRGAFKAFEITSASDKAEMTVAGDNWSNGVNDYADTYISNQTFNSGSKKADKVEHDQQLAAYLYALNMPEDEKEYLYECFKKTDAVYDNGRATGGSGSGSGSRSRRSGSSSSKSKSIPKIESVTVPKANTSIPGYSKKSYSTGSGGYKTSPYVKGVAEAVKRTVNPKETILADAKAAAKALYKNRS